MKSLFFDLTGGNLLPTNAAIHTLAAVQALFQTVQQEVTAGLAHGALGTPRLQVLQNVLGTYLTLLNTFTEAYAEQVGQHPEAHSHQHPDQEYRNTWQQMTLILERWVAADFTDLSQVDWSSLMIDTVDLEPKA